MNDTTQYDQLLPQDYWQGKVRALEARLAETELERNAAIYTLALRNPDALAGDIQQWVVDATQHLETQEAERDELAEWKRTAMRDLQMCIDANKNQQGVIMAQRERIDKLAAERDTLRQELDRLNAELEAGQTFLVPNALTDEQRAMWKEFYGELNKRVESEDADETD